MYVTQTKFNRFFFYLVFVAYCCCCSKQYAFRGGKCDSTVRVCIMQYFHFACIGPKIRSKLPTVYVLVYTITGYKHTHTIFQSQYVQKSVESQLRHRSSEFRLPFRAIHGEPMCKRLSQSCRTQMNIQQFQVIATNCV